MKLLAFALSLILLLFLAGLVAVAFMHDTREYPYKESIRVEPCYRHDSETDLWQMCRDDRQYRQRV